MCVWYKENVGVITLWCGCCCVCYVWGYVLVYVLVCMLYMMGCQVETGCVLLTYQTDTVDCKGDVRCIRDDECIEGLWLDV